LVYKRDRGLHELDKGALLYVSRGTGTWGPPLRLFAPPHANPFTVLLKHQPRVTANMPGRFRLQLSGHTHGGQIFPFGIATALVYKRDRGLHELDKGALLYVSRGTGTWGPPLRLFAPPEVTVITLRPKP
ncbi:MAG: metallophosphoesterase family protein, partial [Planctomycetota bacterium]